MFPIMFSINSFHNVSRDMFTGDAPRMCALKVAASHPHPVCAQYIGMPFIFVQLVFDRMRQNRISKATPNKKETTSQNTKNCFLMSPIGWSGRPRKLVKWPQSRSDDGTHPFRTTPIHLVIRPSPRPPICNVDKLRSAVCSTCHRSDHHLATLHMEGEGGMGLAYLDMLFSGVDPAMVGHGRPWLTMVSHGRPWLAMADHGRSWPALELPADPQHVIHLICWNYLIWLAPTLCSLGGWGDGGGA